jgi:hypothetical protein
MRRLLILVVALLVAGTVGVKREDRLRFTGE